ncbi:phage Gp37/Gp68 family protein [Burkholderia pseudomallei]|uniref:phage Gp37/Gp68 family protein n=1 Tax=Burkholderia pseudomallei TaxID=28450 RepID=UPI003A875BC0
MSENSKIEWCDHTFNPWEGCQKVGPGCDHCYAEARNARFGGGSAVNWGPGAPRRRTSAANWRKPLAWNAAHEQFFAAHGRRQRVFCSSLADVFDNAVYPMWRVDLFELISNTPNLDWLLLTKRIGNARDMISSVLGSIMRDEREWPWPHVWLGATIVNQAEADRDIPNLLAVPARVRFLSMEPLLGPVDLRFHIYSEPTGNFRTHGGKRQLELRRPADGGLHWVIAGGESGHGARPMHPDWARSLRDQCAAAGVPFLFKQWGEWAPRTTDEQKLLPVPCSRTTSWPDGTVGCGDYQSNGDYGKCLFRVGKKATGRMLDGRRHDEFPEVTR